MPIVPPQDPAPTRADRERADRLAREAQALRDNLRRRKQQSRARASVSTTDAPMADKPSAATGDATDDC